MMIPILIFLTVCIAWFVYEVHNAVEVDDEQG